MARDSAKMTATRKVAPTHFWLCNMMAATALTMVCQPPSQETKAEAGEKERPHRLRRGRNRSGFLGLSVATEHQAFMTLFSYFMEEPASYQLQPQGEY